MSEDPLLRQEREHPLPTPDVPTPVEPRRLAPLLPRRPSRRLLVEVDGSPSAYGALVWALREAARREGTVIAVTVVDDADDGLRGPRTARNGAALLDRVEAQVPRAIAETGVHGRARTTVLDRTSSRR